MIKGLQHLLKSGQLSLKELMMMMMMSFHG
jgi:hypothetical protein